jgi:ketosteroid isomerase-like protein
MYRAFARRDVGALLANVDENMRVHDRKVHPEAAVYEGREGFLRFAETDWAAFDEVAYEPQDFVEVGDYVVVQIKQRGMGKGSELGVQETIVNVWRLRDGRCVELRNYTTMDEAMAAITGRTDSP